MFGAGKEDFGRTGIQEEIHGRNDEHPRAGDDPGGL